MVEIEQSAQTLPPLNVSGQAHRRWRSLQELVVESLVVSLAMVVVDVLAHEETHVPFAAEDDATETLLFHRADEPLEPYRVSRRLDSLNQATATYS